MAEDEIELSTLDNNDSELFDEMKEMMEGDEDHDELDQFLVENKLQDHLSLFRDQQIDFETLMILTDPDLKSLGLPLGPYRKLTIALQKKKSEVLGDADGNEDGANKNDSKSKEESDLPTLTDEGNFRVIDESGDDSDTHSVKSDHAGGKKKDDSSSVEPDKNHPYRRDLLNFKLSDEFKVKVELQEPTTIDSKTFEVIGDERRLRNAIKNLRKEKVIAVDAKHVDTFGNRLSLMQISTQNVDYFIEPLLNNQLLLLTDIFTNPNILKVFYDAKHEVKFLQKYYNIFTINAYCVRSAVKELKYETSSLYGLINKYVSYFKPTDSECSAKPLRNDVKLNLRKETHYLLHVYYKTRNEAIEAGVFDSIVAIGTKICGYLHAPLKERKPNNIFQDYDKFNDAQKLAAEELCDWRETVAKDKNTDPNMILNVKDMKQLCLTLPIKKEDLFSVADTRIVRIFALKLLAIMKTARKKYFVDPKDDSKYALKAIEVKKTVKGGRTPAKPSPNAKPKAPANASTPKPNQSLKRKRDTFVKPEKKARLRLRKNLPPKRNSFDGNKSKSPKGSPFRNSGGYRGGYQGNSSNAGKSFQRNMVTYPSPQNIWEPAQNQNFNTSYGAGFKYY